MTIPIPIPIPNQYHPGWLKAISGQGHFEFEFLATKIIMGRLSRDYKRESSPATVRKLVTELHDFFQKNIKQPKVQADLKKIVQGR